MIIKINQRIFFLIYCSLFTCVFNCAMAGNTIIPEVNASASKIGHHKSVEQVQTTYITRDEIKQSPVANLADLLRQQQSIVRLTNNSSDSSQTALSIRGFGDNAVANTLILIDGFPFTNPSLLAPNFNAIALTDIERIEIIQGSQGTLWGDSAVGGVVNIITRHPEKFIADGRMGLGNFNHHFYDLFLGSKFKQGFYFKGFVFADNTNNFRQHNQQNLDSISLQTGFDYARGRIYIDINQFNTNVEYPGGLTQAQFHANPRLATNINNFSHLKTDLYHFYNQHQLFDNWLLETRLSRMNTNGNGFMNSPFNRNDYQTIFNPRLIGTVYYNKIIFGYEFQNSYYQLENSRVHNLDKAQQQDVYLQTTASLLNYFDLSLGGRFTAQVNQAAKTMDQYVSSNKQLMVSEQGLTFHPNDAWQFFIRRDGNFRFVKANEALWIPDAAAALQPQTGVSYELGTIWKCRQQIAQANVYYLLLNNEIAFDPTATPQNPFGSYRNFSQTKRRGLTLTEDYQLTKKLGVYGQFNYVDARFASGIFSGNFIPAVPAINANLGLHYAFTPHLMTQLNALYTGSRFASDDAANIGDKLPGYWLNSLNFQYMLYSLQVNMEIENLLNVRYSTYTLFDPITRTNTFYPGAGRSYLLTLKADIN